MKNRNIMMSLITLSMLINLSAGAGDMAHDKQTHEERKEARNDRRKEIRGERNEDRNERRTRHANRYNNKKNKMKKESVYGNKRKKRTEQTASNFNDGNESVRMKRDL